MRNSISQTSHRHPGPIVLCGLATLIAGGLGAILAVDPPTDLPSLARLQYVMVVCAILYLFGALSYHRRTSSERRTAAELGTWDRNHADAHRLEAVADLLDQERRQCLADYAGLSARLRVVDGLLETAPVNHTSTARKTEDPHLPAGESITAELRAYLAGRESAAGEHGT